MNYQITTNDADVQNAMNFWKLAPSLQPVLVLVDTRWI